MSKRLMASLLAVLLLLSAVPMAAAVTYPCEGVANAVNVRVRKKSSTQANQIGTLDKDETVTVLGDEVKKNGDIWYYVETSGGRKGYVLSDYLSVPETELIQAAQDSPDAALMHLTVKASCRNTNHVGENWTHYYEWNGVTVVDGEMDVFVAPEVELTLYARIRERDGKPDTGTEKLTYLPTMEDAVSGFVVTQTVRVEENSGKYSGKAAVWTVEYIFTPAE